MRRGDDGVATVLALVLSFVIMLVGGVGVELAAVAVARHRAESIADLSALAAAQHAGSGRALACLAARRLVVAQHARLVSCRLQGLDAIVEVGVPLSGELRSLGLVHGRARAGRRCGQGTRRQTCPSYPEKPGRRRLSA